MQMLSGGGALAATATGLFRRFISGLIIPFSLLKKLRGSGVKAQKSGSVRLIAGLAAYKAVEGEDEWAADDIIGRQWNFSQKNGYDGFALFSYSSIVSSEFADKSDFLKKTS